MPNHSERLAAAQRKLESARLALAKARRAKLTEERDALARAKYILGGGALVGGETLIERCLAHVSEAERTAFRKLLAPPTPPTESEPPA